MWKTMVSPLFNAIYMLATFEQSKTEVEEMNSLVIQTFKQFMKIPKSTNTDLVWDMIGDNYNEIMRRNRDNSLEKWFARRERRVAIIEPKIKYNNYLKGIPNEWCEILKQQCRLCIKCKNSTKNAPHMSLRHNIEIENYKEIWENIKEYHEGELEKLEKKKARSISETRLKRATFLKYWRPVLKALKEDTETKYQTVFLRKNDILEEGKIRTI